MNDGPSTRTMVIIAAIIVVLCLAGLWAMGPEPATDDLHGMTTLEVST